ncbi:SDR family oxidoreductase [Streptomyces sp. NPDC047130]|uniref:SDR family NAD(P)-dependent oxidoreductase n=1 Tax=Streptomyces sp. NPDC047130 TaxID=3155261 RepID=UPI0033FF79D9
MTAPHGAAHRMTALVTGATGGMGLAIARRLTHEGARVMLCARDPERAAEEARTLHTSWHAGDLTAPETARTALAEAARRFGRLDVVVAAAGTRGSTRDLGAPMDGECGRILDDNVTTLANTLTAALPALTESKGSFLALSSLAGLTGYPRFPYYTAAKAAAIGLVRAAAPQARRRGVRLRVLCPSFTATPMTEDFAAELRHKGVPVQQPSRVAEAVLCVLRSDGWDPVWTLTPGAPPRPYDFPPFAPLAEQPS